MGRPKRELQAVEEKQTVDVTTNAMLDLKVTKEDVLSVLIQEEEDRLNAELKDAEKHFDDLTEKVKQHEKEIASVVYNNEAFKGFYEEISTQYGYVHMRNQYVVKDYNKKDLRSLKIYDMNKLEGLVNPQKSNSKFTYVHEQHDKLDDYIENLKFPLIKDYKDADGFSGTLRKTFIVSLTPAEKKKIKLIINKLNKLSFPLLELKQSINELSYRILTLDSDRRFKNKLTKTILKSADLNKLFLK